jgi:acyl-CoA synthetase (AMP-forming)/AMP-acid ligase II
VLGASEKSAVFCHAREWFPDLVPTGAGGFDDLPLMDKAGAAVWYGRAVEDSQFFFSSGTSGEPKPVPWTAAEDGWYVGEKRELFARWLGGCSRVFISLAVGHNAGSAHLIFDDVGIEVHDAGLSSLTNQVEVIRTFAPEVLYCSPSILARLVTELEQSGERVLSVRRVITNGEILYPSARARLEVFFGLGRDDIMDTYGSTEIGTTCWPGRSLPTRWQRSSSRWARWPPTSRHPCSALGSTRSPASTPSPRRSPGQSNCPTSRSCSRPDAEWERSGPTSTSEERSSMRPSQTVVSARQTNL